MKKIIFVLLMTSVFCISCGKQEIVSEVPEEVMESPVVSDNNIGAETVSDDVVSPYKEMHLSVNNLCGADFGMFAAIEPITGEQVLLGAVPNGKVLLYTMNWPREVDKLTWAIYTTGGDLYMEGETYVKEAESMVTLMFEGNGEVEKISENVE
ncbi:MAG: hypothetical protein MJ105_09555 [Lachnospiraceae bacterium]|nr:hypothetical protein [Lachnospiraceae bacterium]